MTTLPETISALPQGSWIPIAALVVAGTVLWAAGRRLLRTAFSGVGLLAGAAVGWILGETLPIGLPGWATAVAGALLLALVATMAYRAAVATGLAVVLAAVAGLAVCSAAGWRPSAPAGGSGAVASGDGILSEPLDQLDEWLETLRDDGNVDEAAAGADVPLEERIQDHLEQAETLARHIVRSAAEQWSSMPEELRRRLVAALLVGGAVGFVLGTLAASFSTALVTAFGGALALLLGGWAAACKLGLGDAAWMPTAPRAWLTWWVLLAIIGLMIQWTGRPRRADKPA